MNTPKKTPCISSLYLYHSRFSESQSCFQIFPIFSYFRKDDLFFEDKKISPGKRKSDILIKIKKIFHVFKYFFCLYIFFRIYFLHINCKSSNICLHFSGCSISKTFEQVSIYCFCNT